jgi:DNA polymerase III subunit delta'
MGFDSFIGNRKGVDRLVRKLHEGRFPHGLIFSGPEGLGKHTLALMVAKALNCTALREPATRSASPTGRSPNIGFCDECSNCRKINSGSHPDVMAISLEDEATQIKIGQIRRILGLIDLQPLEGRNKVFVIDPADLLNPEAANALLKGLEEPPPNTYFILVTVNVHELLLTVRSRCQTYNFTPLTLDEIRQYGTTDELAIRWSLGSVGRARSLDISELKTERGIVFDFLETVLTAAEDQFHELLGLSAEIGRAKQEFEPRLAIFVMLIADIIYIKEDLPQRVVNIDLRDQLTRLARRVTVDQLIRMSDSLRTIESGLKSNVNRQIMTDMLGLSANEILHGLS